MQLLAEKKAAIVQAANAAEKSKVVEDRLQGRDLMTLLIKANMSTDIPDRQRLSDEDVLARTSAMYRDILFTDQMSFTEVPTCVKYGFSKASLLRASSVGS